MHSAQPLEILADELGAAAGRIERELRLKDEARAARFEARLAAIELAAFKAEEDRQRKFESRMAELRDGKDGEPGRDGKDADAEPLQQKLDEDLEHIREFVADAYDNLSGKIDVKLAEVKDGKDGEPGKDAEIQPLWDAFNQREINIGATFVDLEEKIDDRLAQVKDGRDGEPGKDADIGPICEEMKRAYAALKKDAEQQVNNVLLTVRNGKDGEPGKDGDPGPPGRDGKDGKDGKLPIAREWTNRVHYAGDVVRHAGATYQALADTGSEPPGGDWGELASRGTDGRGFVLRGTYDASADYRQHDIVMINRNSFAAKYDSPGECPGDGWQLLGASGHKGRDGPPGQRGEPGKDGRSISVAKWEADPDEMVLRVTDSSGDVFVIDLQPIAERILEAAR